MGTTVKTEQIYLSVNVGGTSGNVLQEMSALLKPMSVMMELSVMHLYFPKIWKKILTSVLIFGHVHQGSIKLQASFSHSFMATTLQKGNRNESGKQLDTFLLQVYVLL